MTFVKTAPCWSLDTCRTDRTDQTVFILSSVQHDTSEEKEESLEEKEELKRILIQEFANHIGQTTGEQIRPYENA